MLETTDLSCVQVFTTPIMLSAFGAVYYVLSAQISCWWLKKFLKISLCKPSDLWKSGILSFFMIMPIMQAWRNSFALVFSFTHRDLLLFAVCSVVAQLFYLSFYFDKKIKQLVATIITMQVISLWLTYLLYFAIPYTGRILYQFMWQHIPVA